MKHFIGLFAIACTLSDAIQVIRPNAQYNIRGDTYSGIEWLDQGQTKPTQKEIDQAVIDCNARQSSETVQKMQAITDAKDGTKTTQERLDAIVKVLGL